MEGPVRLVPPWMPGAGLLEPVDGPSSGGGGNPVLQLIFVGIAEVLSFGVCFYLLYMFSRVSSTTRDRLLPKQLVQRARADLLLSFGGLLQLFLQFLPYDDIMVYFNQDPESINPCYFVIFILWAGRAVSIFTEAHITTSFVYSIMGRRGAWWLLNTSLPLAWWAGLLVAGSDIQRSHYAFELNTQREEWKLRTCVPKQRDFVGFLFLIFFFGRAAVIYLWLSWQLRQERGASCKMLSRTWLYLVTFAVPFSLDAYCYLFIDQDRDFWPFVTGFECMAGFINGTTFIVLLHCASRTSAAQGVSMGLTPWDSEHPSSVEDGSNSGGQRVARMFSLEPFERMVLQSIFYLEGLDVMTPWNAPRHPEESWSRENLPDEEGLAAHRRQMENGQDWDVQGPSPSGFWPGEPQDAACDPRGNRNRSSDSGERPLSIFEAGSSSSPASSTLLSRSLSAYNFTSMGVEHAPVSLEQVLHTVRLLGAGEFGTVYLVRTRDAYEGLEPDVLYAAKYMKVDVIGQAMARYMYQERDIMLSIRHPGVVRLHAALRFEHPQMTWVLVMEYCSGGNLYKKVAREGTPGLPLAAAVRHGAEILDALEYLHTRQPAILHRDLKPSNILLSLEGRCKLTDFGLSKAAATSSTMVGSPGFMAPEIVVDRIHDTSADIYSWGRVLMAMLTSSPCATDATTLLEDVGAGAAAPLVMRTTARDPTLRGSAAELKQDPLFAEIDWSTIFATPDPA